LKHLFTIEEVDLALHCTEITMKHPVLKIMPRGEVDFAEELEKTHNILENLKHWMVEYNELKHRMDGLDK
jgi:hypothetical protein